MTLEDIARSMGMPAFTESRMQPRSSFIALADEPYDQLQRAEAQVTPTAKIHVRYYPGEFDGSPACLFTEEQVTSILGLLESALTREVCCHQEVSAQGHRLEFYFPERYRVNILKVFLHRHGRALTAIASFAEDVEGQLTDVLFEHLQTLSPALDVTNIMWCTKVRCSG